LKKLKFEHRKEIIMSEKIVSSPPKVNWKQVGWFIGLTLGLSWLLNLVLVLRFGGISEHMTIFLQLQMFIPAFVAIGLQRFAFADSPIHRSHYCGRPNWFFNFYLLLTLFLGSLVALVTLQPGLYPEPVAGLLALLWLVSIIILVVTRFASGKAAFQQAGLSGGKWYAWPLVWLVVMAYHGTQILLNIAFNLGQAADTSLLNAAAQAVGMDYPTYLVIGYINSLVINPLLGLVIAFGEEYGWRGYLQGELIKLGKLKGVLLVGVVWGFWHAPVVAMGYNYPGHPVLGAIAFLVFNLLLSIFLGYLMLKTGSVWLAAFAHAMLNSGYQWLTLVINIPNDPLFAFGPGLYGIAFALLLALIVLRDPVWRDTPDAS
jgi:membrane protease YdiL (CAAX protease family)